jgi:hypothetical protein
MELRTHKEISLFRFTRKKKKKNDKFGDVNWCNIALFEKKKSNQTILNFLCANVLFTF